MQLVFADKYAICKMELLAEEVTMLFIIGTAGIGLQIAKLLSAAGNKVIITGRDKHGLINLSPIIQHN